MMRLDESRIPKGGGVKIRCPRCKDIDYVEDPSLSKSQGKTVLPSAGRKIDSRPAAGRLQSPRSAQQAREADSGVPEPSIPHDAFQGFRFPAERETSSSSRSASSTRMRILVWGIVSLAVVALFALLVNVILWGPADNGPFLGAKPSGGINRQSPEH